MGADSVEIGGILEESRPPALAESSAAGRFRTFFKNRQVAHSQIYTLHYDLSQV